MQCSTRCLLRSGKSWMSPAAEPPAAGLHAQFGRLDSAVAQAAALLPQYKSRAVTAEAELHRLRHELESIAAGEGLEGGDELKRLRAENSTLRTRLGEGRKRVRALLLRLQALDARR